MSAFAVLGKNIMPLFEEKQHEYNVCVCLLGSFSTQALAGTQQQFFQNQTLTHFAIAFPIVFSQKNEPGFF